MVLSCTVNRKKETGRYENLKMEKWKLDQVTSYRWVTQQFFTRKKISRLFLLFVKRKQSIALSWRVFGHWVLITRKHIINFVNLSFEFLFFNNYYSITCEELHQTPHIVFHPIYSQIPWNHLGYAPILQPFLGAWISDATLLVLVTEFLRMSHCRDSSLHMRQLSLIFWKDEGDQGWKWKLLHTPFLMSANVVLLRSLRRLII